MKRAWKFRDIWYNSLDGVRVGACLDVASFVLVRSDGFEFIDFIDDCVDSFARLDGHGNKFVDMYSTKVLCSTATSEASWVPKSEGNVCTEGQF